MVQSNIANLLSNGLPLHWPFPLSASSSFTSVWSLLPCKFPDIRKQKQRHRTAAPHVTRREQLYFYVSARIFRKLNHSLLNHRRRRHHRHHNHDNAYDGAYDVYDIYDAYEVYGDTGHDAHSTNYNNYANSHCDDESGHKMMIMRRAGTQTYFNQDTVPSITAVTLVIVTHIVHLPA